MKNLLSFCGLVDVRIFASNKDLPVMGSIKCKETDKKKQGQKKELQFHLEFIH